MFRSRRMTLPFKTALSHLFSWTRVTFIARPTGRMMKRYLRGSGKILSWCPYLNESSDSRANGTASKKVSTDGCLKRRVFTATRQDGTEQNTIMIFIGITNRKVMNCFGGWSFVGLITRDILSHCSTRRLVCVVWVGILIALEMADLWTIVRQRFHYGEPFHFPNRKYPDAGQSTRLTRQRPRRAWTVEKQNRSQLTQSGRNGICDFVKISGIIFSVP